MSDWDRATEESGITAGCPVTGHTLYTTQLLGISCSDVNWPAIAVWTCCSHRLASHLMTNCLWLNSTILQEWCRF